MTARTTVVSSRGQTIADYFMAHFVDNTFDRSIADQKHNIAR